MGMRETRRVVDHLFETHGVRVESGDVAMVLLALDSAGILQHPPDGVDPAEWVARVQDARLAALTVVTAERAAELSTCPTCGAVDRADRREIGMGVGEACWDYWHGDD